MKILYILFVVAIITVQAATIFDVAIEEWLLFKVKFRKQYTATEEEYRMNLFIENRYKIARHNYNYEKGLVHYKMEINEFADMLHHEVIHSRNGFNSSVLTQSRPSFPKFVEPAYVELPESVDWRNSGAVTPVKDQGNCGSCWAFSATGALEGQLFRHTGELVSLSEQNLIDCSTSFGNEGCTAGVMDNAFRYVKHNGGIDTEEAYPYKEKVGMECSYKNEYRAGSNRGLVIIDRGDEEKLKAAVATMGPIAVAMDASQESFIYYSEGVYHEPNCSSTQLDHAVLVVGYGSENGKDYWLIKNSWGTYWGDNGYIKVMRNNGNHCGIATYASYPLV